MLKEAINRIVELGAANTVNKEGFEWSKDKLELIKTPSNDILRIHSLESLVKSFADHSYHFNIVSPTKVMVVNPERDKFGRIPVLAACDISDYTQPEISSGREYDVEEFQIKAQQSFVQDDNLVTLMQLVSKITFKEESDLESDGISQKVSARQGVHLTDKVEVKNPYFLKPRGTFPEIEQVKKAYIFRIHTRGNRVTLSLSDVTGGDWEMAVNNNIAKYIVGKAPNAKVV